MPAPTTSIAWPSTLPTIQREGYGLERQPRTVRTEMEHGIPRMRRRSRALVTTATARLLLTAAQGAVLDAFFADDLAEGSAWFLLPIPRPGDPTGATPVPCRFQGPPKQSPAGARWHYEFTLDVYLP